jgi:hypothetical protein
VNKIEITSFVAIVTRYVAVRCEAELGRPAGRLVGGYGGPEHAQENRVQTLVWSLARGSLLPSNFHSMMPEIPCQDPDHDHTPFVGTG